MSAFQASDRLADGAQLAFMFYTWLYICRSIFFSFLDRRRVELRAMRQQCAKSNNWLSVFIFHLALIFRFYFFCCCCSPSTNTLSKWMCATYFTVDGHAVHMKFQSETNWNMESCEKVSGLKCAWLKFMGFSWAAIKCFLKRRLRLWIRLDCR